METRDRALPSAFGILKHYGEHRWEVAREAWWFAHRHWGITSAAGFICGTMLAMPLFTLMEGAVAANGEWTALRLTAMGAVGAVVVLFVVGNLIGAGFVRFRRMAQIAQLQARLVEEDNAARIRRQLMECRQEAESIDVNKMTAATMGEKRRQANKLLNNVHEKVSQIMYRANALGLYAWPVKIIGSQETEPPDAVWNMLAYSYRSPEHCITPWFSAFEGEIVTAQGKRLEGGTHDPEKHWDLWHRHTCDLIGLLASEIRPPDPHTPDSPPPSATASHP